MSENIAELDNISLTNIPVPVEKAISQYIPELIKSKSIKLGNESDSAKKKHKKSKKSREKHKHKDKDRDKDRDRKSGQEKSDKKSVEISDVQGVELSAIEKFNMFKKQRESVKDNDNVVDDMFKDFIASKIRHIESESNKDTKNKSKSVYEINKFLDKAISNIVLPCEKDTDEKNTDFLEIIPLPNASQLNLTTMKSLTPKDVSGISILALQTTSHTDPKFEKELTADSNKQPTVFVPLLPKTVVASDIKDAIDAKVPDVKKPVGFKNFGIKLSASSAELIQSGELHKKGKRLEEGEVMSSSSDGSDSSDTENDDLDEDDGEISGTGSLSDTDIDSKSGSKSKKKKNRKHKKKRKHKDKAKDIDDGKDTNKSKRRVSQTSQSRSRSPKRVQRSHSRSRERSKRRSRSKSDGISKHSRSRNKRSASRGRHKSRSRSHGRRSRSQSYRSRSRTSRSRSRSRGRRSRSRGHRSRSTGPERFWRSKYGDFDAFKYTRGKGARAQCRSSDQDHDRFSHKDKRKPDDRHLKIDKTKLREIAIKNAVNIAKVAGTPLAVAIKAGGKSVEELTEYCKKIQEKEDERRKESHHYDSSSDEEPAQVSDDEPFHHPFQVKEPATIIMDIKNAKQLPVVTPQERLVNSAQLRITFPVSSGSQHREKEWVPVEPEPSKPKAAVYPLQTGGLQTGVSEIGGIITQPAPPLPKQEVKVFEDVPFIPVDISSIVSERLNAVRKLQENPNDVVAKEILNRVQTKASQWAQSKHLPGQFIGSTGATILSQEELIGNKKRQAWLKKVGSTSKVLHKFCYLVFVCSDKK